MTHTDRVVRFFFAPLCPFPAPPASQSIGGASLASTTSFSVSCTISQNGRAVCSFSSPVRVPLCGISHTYVHSRPVSIAVHPFAISRFAVLFNGPLDGGSLLPCVPVPFPLFTGSPIHWWLFRCPSTMFLYPSQIGIDDVHCVVPQRSRMVPFFLATLCPFPPPPASQSIGGAVHRNRLSPRYMSLVELRHTYTHGCAFCFFVGAPGS